MGKQAKFWIILGCVAVVFLFCGLGFAVFFSSVAENSTYYTRLGLHRDTGVANVNRLALALAQEISKAQPDKTANMLVAPYDVARAAALLGDGAQGTARDALASLLFGVKGDRYDTKKQQFLLLGKDVEQSRAAYGGMRVLDSLWVNSRSGKPAPDFAKSAKEEFGITAAAIDFAHPQAVQSISAWQQKQSPLLPALQGAPVSGDGLMAAASVYFKVSWPAAFDPVRTTVQTFVTDDRQRLSVPMMHRIYESPGTLQWQDRPDYEAVSVPCCFDAQDGQPHMRLILLIPKLPDVTARTWLEKQNALKPSDWLRTSKYVNATGVLSLPRLSIDDAADLSAPLKAAGGDAAFAADADYSKITGTPGALPSRLLHSVAFVADEGTTAPAPASEGTKASLGDAYVMTRFNRSFAFAVLDAKTGIALLVGIVNKPVP